MKRVNVVLSACLMILLILLCAAPLSAETLTARRLIEVDEYGFVYVVDDVPAADGSAEIGFPRELLTQLVDYSSPNGEPELVVLGDIFILRVKAGPDGRAKLTTLFGDLITRSGEDAFRLQFPLNPIMLGSQVTNLGLKVILPEGCEPQEFPDFLEAGEDGRSLSGLMQVNASSPQTFTVDFLTGDMRLLKAYVMELSVNPASREAEFTVKLRMNDGEPMNGLALNLPPGSKLIEVKDPLRRLSNSYDEETGRLHVTFHQELTAGTSKSLTVKFRPPEGSVYQMKDGLLTVKPLLPINFSAHTYILSIELEATKYLSSEPEPSELVRTYPEKLRLTYYLGIVSPLSVDAREVRLRLEMRQSRFSALPPLWGVAVAVFALGLFVSAVKLRIRRTVTEEEKRLRDFVESADAVFAACQRIADLISTQRILDKGYVRPRLLELRSSIRKHAGRAAHLASQLRREFPKLSEPIDAASKAAQKIERETETLWTQTHRYLTGSTSKSTFSKQAEEHYKKIKESHRDLSEALEKLRQKLS